MSVEPGGDRSEIVLHAVEPFGERWIVTSRPVGARGASRRLGGGRCGIVMMRAPSARAAAIRGSAMMSAKALAPSSAPVRHSLRTMTARGGLIRSRKYGRRGRLSGIGGEKIDRDKVEAELLDRQGDGRVGEPLDQSEQHWTRVEDHGAPRLG